MHQLANGDQFKLIVVMQVSYDKKQLRTYVGSVRTVNTYAPDWKKYLLTHETTKFTRSLYLIIKQGRVEIRDEHLGRPIYKYALYINGVLMSQSRGGITLYHAVE